MLLGSSVFSLSFAPFLFAGQAPLLLQRLLSLNDLSHSFAVPNFWACYNAFEQLCCALLRGLGSSIASNECSVLPRIPWSLTLVPSAIPIFPALYCVWQRPVRIVLMGALLQCMFTCFIFAWHVRDTSILLIAIPLSLIAGYDWAYAKLAFMLTTVATCSLVPLLPPLLLPFELVLAALYTYISWRIYHYIHTQNTLKRFSDPLHLTALEIAYFRGLAMVSCSSHLLSYNFPTLAPLGNALSSLYHFFGLAYCYVLLYLLFLHNYSSLKRSK
jgi:hypothetical protein